jgi:hypothetical protein
MLSWMCESANRQKMFQIEIIRLVKVPVDTPNEYNDEVGRSEFMDPKASVALIRTQ